MKNIKYVLVLLAILSLGAFFAVRVLTAQWLPAVILGGGGAVGGAWWLGRRLEQSCRLLAAAGRSGGIDPSALASRVFLEELRDVAFALGSAEERWRRRMDVLESERLRFEEILASLPVGVLVLDRDGGIRYANPPLAALLRDTPREGEPFQRLVRHPDLHTLLEGALKGEAGDRLIVLRGEERRYLAVRGVPVASGGSVAVLSDVTERHALEESRKAFVADAGHELQTPLAVVRAAAELLLEESTLGEEDRLLVSRVLAQQERMSTLVDDLLLLSRLEMDSALPIDTDEELDLAEVARGALETARIHPLGEHIAWRAELPDHAPCRGWREGILRSLGNLLDNAVKYTRERFGDTDGGLVVLRLFCEDHAWCFEVEDNGIGVPPRLRGAIFEPFRRGDASRTRQIWGKGGYGLGLAMVKKVMELHGGQVCLGTEERGEAHGAGASSEGARFLLRFPKERELLG